MKTMNEAMLGARVKYYNVLLRQHAKDEQGKPYKAWKSFSIALLEGKPWETIVEAKMRTGIIVGKRRLTNGYTNYEDEVGYYYEQAESITAFLVSWNMNRALDMVLPEDISFVKEASHE